MQTKPLLVTFGVLVLLVAVFFLFTANTPAGALTKDEAADVVITLYPELAAYRTTSLPPSSIEGQQSRDGWYLGFIQRGSGVPGILSAKCYHVTNEKAVTPTGTYARSADVAENISFETCTAAGTGGPPTSALPFGGVVLKLGDTATFQNISIRALSIEEDSRCPADVQCIQAGTVRVRVEVVSGMGTSTSILKLGTAFTTEAERITLTAVSPAKKSQTAIATGDYRLTFEVVPQSAPAADKPTGKCYVGGCSGQLCTSDPDAVSTCEYREEYGCYKNATCGRQATGQCGWTPTPQLAACIAAAR